MVHCKRVNTVFKGNPVIRANCFDDALKYFLKSSKRLRFIVSSINSMTEQYLFFNNSSNTFTINESLNTMTSFLD